jgi:hypothetical protein
VGIREGTNGSGGLAVFVGTRAGLFEWQAGRVTPLSTGSESITALGALRGERLVAGTGSGALLVVDRRGRAVRAASPPSGAAITSLLALPSSPTTEPRLLASTATGTLLEARLADSAHRRSDALRVELVERRVAADPAPAQLAAVTGRPRSAIVVATGRGLTFLADAADPSAAAQPWSREPIVELAAHASDASLWLARTPTALVRSNDGARTFRPVTGWPTDLRPRLVHFAAGDLALAVAFPTPEPPDPADPSPLWTSHDAGLSFHPVPSRTIDRARDPSGEITALATTIDRATTLVLVATDRGELLQWRGTDSPAELLADHLPPVTTLLALRAAPELDPSTSGIHLLP